MPPLGDVVLLRAEISADGRQVLVAPGVELSTDAVEIVSDVPRFTGGPAHALMFFFATKAEFELFVDRLRDTHGMDEAA